MESLGGKLAGPPGAVSWGPDRMDVFAIAVDASIQHWYRDGNSWSTPQPLPGGNAANLPAEGLSVVSRGPNLLDVFAAGAQGNTPWHWWWDGANWGGPQPLPGGANLPAERVSAVSSALNRLDVFAPGSGNLLWHWEWDGLNWSAPESLPAPVGGVLPAEGVSAVSWGGDRLDVFAAVTGPNSLQHWWREGGAGWQIEDLGGNLPQESVTAISPAPGRLDVFACARGAGLMHWSQYSGTWSREDLGGDLPAEGVGAIASPPDRLDVFAVAPGSPIGGGELLHWWWDGSNWVGPAPLGGNLPAFDVTALQQGSDRIDVFAAGSDGSLQHWPDANWTNWAGNQVETPFKLFQPSGVDDLVAEIQAAEQNGLRVRAVGSSWSYSDISRTYETSRPPGCMVMTERLSATLTHVTNSALNANGQARRLYHVEAGITLRELCQRLDRAGLALPTLGGSAGQSLAGAISTSVHGGDFDRPPVPDMVQAIHLVAAGGTQHWIERSNPITQQSQLELLVPGVKGNIHYDDDWFNSVVVSMGCMGIIYSLIIEVLPRHYLAEVQHNYPWSQARGWLNDGTAFGGAFDGGPLGDPPIGGRGALRFLQIVINPHLNDAGDHTCIVTTRYALAAVDQPPPNQWVAPTFAALLGLPPTADLIAQIAARVLPVLGVALLAAGIDFAMWAASFPTLGDFLAALIAFAVSHGFPGIVAAVEEIALFLGRPAEPNKQGLSYLLMAGDGEQNLFKAFGIEIAFPASNDGYLRFVDAALGLAGQQEGAKPVGGIISLRFAGRSAAFLAIEQWDITCIVEVDLIRGLAGNFEFLEQLEAIAGSYGGILHWGLNLDGSNNTGSPRTDNQNYINCAAVAQAYPGVGTWIDIRRQLTDNGTLHTFDNALSARCCLNVPPEIAVTLQVQVNNLVDHINGTPEQLALVNTYPRVTIADGTYVDPFDTAASTFRKSVLTQDLVPVQIEVWRDIRHVILRGVAKLDSFGHWWVYFGKTRYPLPDDYDSLPPEEQLLLTTYEEPGPPGVAAGIVRTIALQYSHRQGMISGDVSGNAGAAMHVPNGDPNTVEFDLTVAEI